MEAIDARSAVELSLILLGQIVLAVVYIVTTRMWVNFLAKRVDAHDQAHRDHYAHASDRIIHQESMDAKLEETRFTAISERLEGHVADDLRLFNEIKADLKGIRDAVQYVRENMPKHFGDK